MSKNTPENLIISAELVDKVADEYRLSSEAYDERAEAETALLEAVIERVRPGLRAIATRPIAEEVAHDIGTHTQWDEPTTYHEPCVCLSDDKMSPDEERRSHGVVYSGERLVLLVDGTLAQLEWSGERPQWQGSTSVMRSSLARYESVGEAVADGWANVEIYIRTLADRLERAQGTRDKITKISRDRAAKLAAITELLKK